MRTYALTVWRGDCDCEHFEVQSTQRIRPLLIELFREDFHRDPDFHWHQDGFMAEAWIRHEDHAMRPYMIQLEQLNRWCPFQSGGHFLPVPRSRSSATFDSIERQLQVA